MQMCVLIPRKDALIRFWNAARRWKVVNSFSDFAFAISATITQTHVWILISELMKFFNIKIWPRHIINHQFILYLFLSFCLFLDFHCWEEYKNKKLPSGSDRPHYTHHTVQFYMHVSNTWAAVTFCWLHSFSKWHSQNAMQQKKTGEVSRTSHWTAEKSHEIFASLFLCGLCFYAY